jgi:hypothetical protein
MRGKLLSTLALRLESHTATPSLMFAQRDGNLRRREGGGTVGASRSKWRISAKFFMLYYCSYQLNITVLVPELYCTALDVRIICWYYRIADQSNFFLYLDHLTCVYQPITSMLSHIIMGYKHVEVLPVRAS